MRRRPGYRDGRYRGFAGTDRVGLLGMFLSLALGIGLPALLTLFLQSRLPLPRAAAVMTAAFLVGLAVSWLCRRRDWPLLSLFQLFSVMTLLFFSLTLRHRVIERVVFQDTRHLSAAGIAIGILTTVLLFRWMKKREDRPSPFLWAFFALFLGFLAYSFSLGALLGVNILADGGPVQSTAAQVLRLEKENRRTYGRVSSNYTVYFVVVKENGLTSGGRFPIDKPAYDSLHPGDEVELILHPGALGASWIECVIEESP
ncbi:MAG: hypothetical protein HFF04_04175 [Oscillospiraceae bacterium]|nr:hypothetical protein [Oscillospiraceae bacterium]